MSREEIMTENGEQKKYHEVFRLTYLNEEIISKNKSLITPTFFIKFSLPNDMTKEEAFKVISFIMENVTKSEKLPEHSLASVRATDMMLNTFGFKRLHFDEETRCVDLLVCSDGRPDFRRWFTPNVKKEEVEQIYDKCNLKFPSFAFEKEKTLT